MFRFHHLIFLLVGGLSAKLRLLLGDTQSLSSASSASATTLGQYQELSHLPHKNCSGTIDGETILNCKVEFPGDGKWIPYTFKWTKLGASKPLFFRFPGYPPHLEASYENRVKMTVSDSEWARGNGGKTSCDVD